MCHTCGVRICTYILKVKQLLVLIENHKISKYFKNLTCMQTFQTLFVPCYDWLDIGGAKLVRKLAKSHMQSTMYSAI